MGIAIGCHQASVRGTRAAFRPEIPKVDTDGNYSILRLKCRAQGAVWMDLIHGKRGQHTNSQILHPHVFRDQMDSHRNFLRIYNRQADSKQRKTGTVEVMRTLLSTEHAQRAMDICSIPI